MAGSDVCERGKGQLIERRSGWKVDSHDDGTRNQYEPIAGERKNVAKQNPTAQPVIVIDDDPLFRGSITRLLEAEGYRPDVYESLGEFRSGGKLPQVGCAVLDLNLPDATGLEIQQELARLAPALSIVFLTAFGQVTSGVQAMEGGAVDFLEKPAQDAVILEAIRRALERSQTLREGQLELDELGRRFARLSAREREVFGLITAGLLNKQAAAELGITEATVKVHRARVMEKLQAKSLAELVRIAHRITATEHPGASSSATATTPARFQAPGES